jgi:DNA-binding LacI/PurR family transcriptional regulator
MFYSVLDMQTGLIYHGRIKPVLLPSFSKGERMARATIDEVAALAGVTKSTVSHALSGKRPVAPETRARIEAAIAALGYRPNAIAQRLAAGRSRAIGLVFPPGQKDITLHDTPFIAAASGAAARGGYALVLVQGDRGSLALTDTLASGLLDGALLLRVGLRDARIDLARAAGVPFVLIGRTADNAGLSFVDVDVDAAVDLLVERLCTLGHRRIALLRPAGVEDAMAGRALQAYELACARRRVRLLTAPCPASVRGAQDAAATLLGEHADITGLLVWGEAAAWGASLGAAEHGRVVPDDLSIACLGLGLGDELLAFDPDRADLQPAQLAETAVEILLAQLAGDGAGEGQLLLQPESVGGQTLAPPRAP